MGQAAFAVQGSKRHDSGVFPVMRVAPSQMSEEQLVDALIANDARAWGEFQRRYDRLILRCITKVTKRFVCVGPEDVREIYAQLLVSLLANDKAKLRTFDPERGNRFSSWVGLLAIHGAYDHLRALRREPPKEVLTDATDICSETPDPYELTEQRERANIASRVLAGFSERDRTFAALYFGEGMAPEAIAMRMNISVKTVYSKKHKIQSRLEAMLGASIAA
jgi:RNA polymerase sigma-70 factor (ECF subfamily)